MIQAIDAGMAFNQTSGLTNSGYIQGAQANRGEKFEYPREKISLALAFANPVSPDYARIKIKRMLA